VTRLGLISDTHGKLRAEVFTHFAGVSRVLHAGDIGNIDILVELAAIAPVDAVIGNTDGDLVRQNVAPEVTLSVEGRTIILVHGHELGSPTPAKLAAAYPDADIVVFGHTHKPTHERIGRQRFVNPGSAGAPRFGLRPTIGVLTIDQDDMEVMFIELA
jgi:putative phosphoesterase